MSSAAVAATYKDVPLLLNLERDAVTGKWRLASTWCNLGLWTAASEAATQPQTFRNACEALALALGDAAGLTRGDAVLDVGVGYADQTALWATHFGVRRVVAVERSAEHVAAAREAQQTGRLAGSGVVELCVGSATNLDALLTTLPPGDSTFDVVLSLDCAYHFQTRAEFVRAAARALVPGGRFASIDLLAGDGTSDASSSWVRSIWRRCARRVIAAACDIPSANLYGLAEYKRGLEAAGLRVDTTTRLTERVLSPFAAHAARQRLALAAELAYGQSVSLWLISALFTFVAWCELFEVVLITAHRPHR